MTVAVDFSTNRHSTPTIKQTITERPPVRHADLCFNDGNIAVLAAEQLFIVHRGLLSRNSDIFRRLLESMDSTCDELEGRPVLRLPDRPDYVSYLLRALYDGISFLAYDAEGFPVLAGLLRLLTKYQILRIRGDVLRGLAAIWPTTLAQWEAREGNIIDAQGLYSPHKVFPHPIDVINLAREIGFHDVLPAAMYDLSRYNPSDTAAGYLSLDGSMSTLTREDLLNVLRGREHASRFFSTFIVNELEGRKPSSWCFRRKDDKSHERRACQIAFEAITFELLRDVNGVISSRPSDPLYAMADAELMQLKDDLTANDGFSPMKTCEACRAEFSVSLEAVREEFWRKLPTWFGVEDPNWG